MRRLALGTCVGLVLVFWSAVGRGDGPADNDPERVRRVPKVGVEVPAEVRERLKGGLKPLAEALGRLAQKNDARTAELLPDVQIYERAVREALEYQEFFDVKEFAVAEKLLEMGLARAQALERGDAPWTTQTGLVVRGYVSRLDGSVQPYGLVIPASYSFGGAVPHRLDVWCHGRGEALSELNFINTAQSNPGQFTPADTIVLHPYGRYCNAFKLAGEIDVLEGLASVQRRYRVDENRIAMRGFSMGGAGCWQFAVHYADRWMAATPGAGFSETPDFLRVFQKETLNPPWYERKLYRWYDCTDWCGNLLNCPTVAYSGEDDIQKQAADIMAARLKEEGIELVHLIGPKTGHSYHPGAKAEIERRLASIATRGREVVPRRVSLTTYTLRYNRMFWVQIDGIEEHWEKSRVDAGLLGNDGVAVLTSHVTDLTLQIPAGYAAFDPTQPVEVMLDGEPVRGAKPASDRSWSSQFHKHDGRWVAGARASEGLRKRAGLQGPVDDAFLDSFLFVRPTGNAAHPAVGAWCEAEFQRAVEHWRRQMRGHARVKDDTQVTADDIARHHLVLWGDPSSNAVLGKVAGELPIRWTAESITAGAAPGGAEPRSFVADQHALIAVYPNPLNRERYVVLNSGFTYREYDYLNNARQTPKLPDWAIVDLRTAPGTQWPGKIVAADFFDEAWRLKPARGE